MLIVTQNQLNQLVVTLTEFKKSSTKIYLVELVNQTSAAKSYFISTDLSTSPNRYNLFCVTETSQASGGTNPYNSQVALPLSGFYYYNIYENPGSVLSPSGLNQVETGKLLVLANKIQNNPTYAGTQPPLSAVYNPETFLQ